MTAEAPVTAANAAERVPLVEMNNIRVAFGGVHAVDDVSIDLYPGEVVGLVGGNGAGKSTLIRTLSGAHAADSGEIRINGEPQMISNPRDAKAFNIECIYQTLALADNIDAPGNVFLGREMQTWWRTLDEGAMEDATRKVMGRLNPNFTRFAMPVKSLSGGQRQAVAIARAVHFNARILIMDEPTAALGPAETAQVRDLIRQLKAEGIGIFLISHDLVLVTLDSPRPGIAGQPLNVQGWAIDGGSANGTGVQTVHVYAIRMEGPPCSSARRPTGSAVTMSRRSTERDSPDPVFS